MPSSFKDHFSKQATDYARYRPSYPDALFAYLTSLTPSHEQAWDCGTGNGQAAHGLARHFAHVVATDASAAQLAQAAPHERITYRVARAEDAPLADASVDLVTVAQALHWFDLDAFFAEARRVLKPEGVLAVWTYGLPTLPPAVEAVFRRYYDDVVGPYWPPERRLVEAGYTTIPFPFAELEPPAFHLEARWSLRDLIGFLYTWSATQRFIEQRGLDPVEQIREDLAAAWGPGEEHHLIRWPVPMRVGRR